MVLCLSIVFRQRVLTQLTLDENYLVRELKCLIAKPLGIPPEDQILTANGILLEDRRRLRDYHFSPVVKVNLDVPLSRSSKMKVYIKTPSQTQPLKLRVRMERTLGELKRIISHYAGIVLSDRVLIDKNCVVGKESDDKTLALLGLRENSVIQTDIQRVMSHPPYSESGAEIEVGRYRAIDTYLHS